jgi:DNA repair photolyase
MIVKEVFAKSILSKSQIYDYTINCYVGCSHSCRYCYAAFMKRFTGHKERWGEFVDVKLNAPELLAKEIIRKRAGRVWVSGVCDPYQAAEKKYKLTGMCLEILAAKRWPVTIQTKSSLVLRDIEILKRAKDTVVGFSIATADEKMKKLFEPGASPIKERLAALGVLHAGGITTFAMIAPILPGAEGLVKELVGKVDYVLVDKLNYHYANRLYRENKLEWAIEDPFFIRTADALKSAFEEKGVPVQVLC